MKPSHLAQSASPRLFGLLLVTFVIGCAGTAPQPTGDDDDEPPPPMVKQPPAPKDGNGTAPNCDGVTEAGKCEDGVAKYCDVEADMQLTKDCRALGKSCVMTEEGAKCEVPASGGTCEGGLTNEGMCAGETAVWCDSTGAEPQEYQYDCAGVGLDCRTDCKTDAGTAIPGAFCCADPNAAPTNECPALGFEGECEGQEARWCNGDTLIEQQCDTMGKQCMIDPEFGAYCGTPMVSECEQLGFEGDCVDGKPRWCSGGEVMEVTCGAGTVCKDEGPDCAATGTDAGAYCCSST